MVNDLIDYSAVEPVSLSKIRAKIKKLRKEIENLKNISDMEIIPPGESDEYIVIPVNCTCSGTCFARLFLLKDHVVISRIISETGLLQFQIPIRREYEEVIALTYGSYYLTELVEPPKEEIGFSLIVGGIDYYAKYSPIFGLIKYISEQIDVRKKRDMYLKEVQIDYEYELGNLKIWIRDNLKSLRQQLMQVASVTKWKNEFRLYLFFKTFFPDAVYQYRDDWLDYQSLDIYIPSKRVGIEYQGEQHYKASEFFGGEASFLAHRERDIQKRKKCRLNNVELIEWNYKDKVVYENVEIYILSLFQEINLDFDTLCKLLMRGVPFKVENILLDGMRSQNETHENSDESGNKPKRTPTHVIRQYDECGNLVSEYESLQLASEATGVGVSSIFKCISGQRRHAGDYRWTKEKYGSTPQILGKDDISSSPIIEGNDGKPKAVVQIDTTTGEVIRSFNSIGAAATSVGIHRKGISDVLAGRQKTAGGYYWGWKSE